MTSTDISFRGRRLQGLRQRVGDPGSPAPQERAEPTLQHLVEHRSYPPLRYFTDPPVPFVARSDRCRSIAQNQTGDSLGVVDRQILTDQAAHRYSAKMRARDIKFVEQREDV